MDCSVGTCRTDDAGNRIYCQWHAHERIAELEKWKAEFSDALDRYEKVVRDRNDRIAELEWDFNEAAEEIQRIWRMVQARDSLLDDCEAGEVSREDIRARRAALKGE